MYYFSGNGLGPNQQQNAPPTAHYAQYNQLIADHSSTGTPQYSGQKHTQYAPPPPGYPATQQTQQTYQNSTQPYRQLNTTPHVQPHLGVHSGSTSCPPTTYPRHSQHYTQKQHPIYPNSNQASFPQRAPAFQNSQHSASSQFAHNTSSRSTESCYNCGGLGHWAQDCPEPRRAIPAGDMKRSSKRQRLQVPSMQSHTPQTIQLPNLRGGWDSLHPSYQPYQNPTAPPTPVSASSLPQNYWSAPQYPNAAQQQQDGQPWAPAGLPTPGSSYDSQHPSPSSAATNPTQYSFPPQCVQSYPPQTESSQQQTSTTETQSYEPQVDAKVPAWQTSHTNEIKNWAPISRAGAAPSELDGEDDWLEELAALDAEESLHQIGLNPPVQVGQPLPSNMPEADAICPLPTADDLPSDFIASKYFQSGKDETYLLTASNRSDWTEVRDDPAFSKIAAKCETVTFGELVCRRKAAVISSDSLDDTDDCTKLGDTGDKHEAAHSPARVLAGTYPATSQSFETEEQRLSREQEERLAALGVTGTAKPVITVVPQAAGPLPLPTVAAPLRDYNNNLVQPQHMQLPSHDAPVYGQYSASPHPMSNATPAASYGNVPVWTDGRPQMSPPYIQGGYLHGSHNYLKSPAALRLSPPSHGYAHSQTYGTHEPTNRPSLSHQHSTTSQHQSRKRPYDHSNREIDPTTKQGKDHPAQQRKHK